MGIMVGDHELSQIVVAIWDMGWGCKSVEVCRRCVEGV